MENFLKEVLIEYINFIEDYKRFMKTVFLIARILVIALLALNLLYWVAIYGSGHQPPPDTERLLTIWVLVLTLALILLIIIPRKLMKK